jgi:hypothetical protein
MIKFMGTNKKICNESIGSVFKKSSSLEEIINDRMTYSTDKYQNVV